MKRIDVEVKLNESRTWALAQFAALSEEDLLRPLTPSEHDPTSAWSAKDHLAHLAGIERGFNRMIRRHLAGEANPVGLMTGQDGTPRTREQIMALVHETTEAWVCEHREKTLT